MPMNNTAYESRYTAPCLNTDNGDSSVQTTFCDFSRTLYNVTASDKIVQPENNKNAIGKCSDKIINHDCAIS